MKRYRELLEKVLNSVPFSHSHLALKKEIEEELAKPEPDPVAWLYGGKLSDGADDFNLTFNEPEHGYKVPLYTSPPQQKPFSEKEIRNIYASISKFNSKENIQSLFAKAIEKSHGIGN